MSQIYTASSHTDAAELTTPVNRLPAVLLAGMFAIAAYTAGALIQVDLGADLTERNARAHARLEQLGVAAPDAVLVR